MRPRSKFLAKTIALSLVVAVLLSFTAPLASAAPDFPFTDVPQNHWARGYIEWAYREDFVSGFPDVTFRPGNNVTRAQFATILWNHAGQPVAPPATFTDAVPYWAQAAVNWAAHVGVVNGFPDGSFGAGRNIQRQQIVAMLYRYITEVLGVRALQPETSLVPYTDSNRVSGWAVGYMRWGTHIGIIGAGGTLNPTGAATRAQTVAMFFRAFDPGFIHIDVVPRAFFYVNEWLHQGRTNFTPFELFNNLMRDGFSREDAMRGVEAVLVDWTQMSAAQALQRANVVVAWGITPPEMAELLAMMMYSNDEIQNALAGINWNAQATFVAADLSWWAWLDGAGNRRNPTAAELNPPHDVTCPQWLHRQNLVQTLHAYGFTEAQAIFGASNRANINTMAIREAASSVFRTQNGLEGGISRARLIFEMSQFRFTEAEAAFGADNVGANWNAQAVGVARVVLSFGGFSQRELLEILTTQTAPFLDPIPWHAGFTQAQAEHAVATVAPDWNLQALMAAINYVFRGEFTFADDDIYQLRGASGLAPAGVSRARLEFFMADWQLITEGAWTYRQGAGFTAAQVTYASEAINELASIWNAQAVVAAQGLLEVDPTLTRANLIAALTATTSTWTDTAGVTITSFSPNGGFTPAQAEHAANAVGLTT